MNTKILSKLIFIIWIVIFTGCSFLKDDEENFKGTMQAKINGELIIFDEAYGDRILGEDLKWSGIVHIVGKTDLNVSGYEIQLDFPVNSMKGIKYHPSCMYGP